MEFLKKPFDKIEHLFEKGAKWEKFYPIYEGHRTILFAPKLTTSKKGSQIKDAVDFM